MTVIYTVGIEIYSRGILGSKCAHRTRLAQAGKDRKQVVCQGAQILNTEVAGKAAGFLRTEESLSAITVTVLQSQHRTFAVTIRVTRISQGEVQLAEANFSASSTGYHSNCHGQTG